MSDTWVAYMADLDGFVVEDPEAWLTAMTQGVDALEAYERAEGFQVGTISVSRGAAAPKPQYEGSQILREPGTWRSIDRISFEAYDFDYEQAALHWRVVQAIAKGLNEEGK